MSEIKIVISAKDRASAVIEDARDGAERLVDSVVEGAKDSGKATDDAKKDAQSWVTVIVKGADKAGDAQESAADKTRDAWSDAKTSVKSYFADVAKVAAGNILANLAAAPAKLAAGIIEGGKRLAGFMVQTAASVEQLRMQLETATKGKGEAWFQRLNTWAMRMPVNTQEAIRNFIGLRNMGVNPTIDRMTVLVDTVGALGGGEETLQGISMALGQIATKGKVSAEELLQLAERGVPVFEILREELEMTRQEVSNIGSSGIDTGRVIDAIFAGLAKRFGGQSKRMQSSWDGMVETMRSSAQDFARRVMDRGPFKVMKDQVKAFIDYMDTARGQLALDRWVDRTAKAILLAMKGVVMVVQRAVKGVDFYVRSWHILRLAIASARVELNSWRADFAKSKSQMAPTRKARDAGRREFELATQAVDAAQASYDDAAKAVLQWTQDLGDLKGALADVNKEIDKQIAGLDGTGGRRGVLPDRPDSGPDDAEEIFREDPFFEGGQSRETVQRRIDARRQMYEELRRLRQTDAQAEAFAIKVQAQAYLDAGVARVDVARWYHAQIDALRQKHAEKVRETQATITEEINKLTMSELEHRIWALDQELDALRKQGAKEEDLERLKQARLAEIRKDARDEARADNRALIADLERDLAGINRQVAAARAAVNQKPADRRQARRDERQRERREDRTRRLARERVKRFVRDARRGRVRRDEDGDIIVPERVREAKRLLDLEREQKRKQGQLNNAQKNPNAGVEKRLDTLITEVKKINPGAVGE